MSFIINHYGHNTVEIHTGRYTAGQLYVELQCDGEPFACLSICFPELKLRDDEFAFKTYSENHGFLDQLLEQSAVEVIRTEFCSLGYVPICRLTQT